MLKPVLQDDAFLADIASAQSDPDRLHLWWLGQSGFLVQWQGHHLLLDPYLSDSLTRKYAGSDKPHVRMTERVVAPERLSFVEAVTSSHNHTDHLDTETLVPLLEGNPDLRIIVSHANLDIAAGRLKVSPDRFTSIRADGEGIFVDPFTFHAIPSAHESLEQDEAGDQRFIGFIVQAGPWTIYHSGDCVLYDGLVDRLRSRTIDVALLPINGRDPARGVAGNFSAEEAARLGKEIHAGIVVPCHYEMFEFNSVSPRGFVEAAQRIGQKYVLLKNGGRLDL